ncbi:MAG: carboxymuconolactone decarboxylase family protein [Planctomycetes bacterium]|nr:carboxymuconolactone decarboxylase family protein [Planctomycetota bacterium]
MRAVAAVTASLAMGNNTRLRRAMAAARRARVPVPWMEEALLQSLLFAGYPRTIQAFDEWRRSSSGGARRASAAAGPSLVTRRRLGHALCRRIYGEDAFPRLLRYMSGLHPLLAEWAIEEGYGRVLSRPGLDVRRRELALLPILVAQGAWPQFLPHLKGAVRCGATPHEILELWRALRCWLPEGWRRKAMRMTKRILNTPGAW